MRKTPSYRQRVGTTKAIVTLTDSLTKKRRDYWLGEYGSPESRERFHRVIAEWEANDRRLPRQPIDAAPNHEPGALTITELVHEYWRWADTYYLSTHKAAVKVALRLLRRYCGRVPAAEFGPRMLRLLREEMIRGDLNDEPPRRPWARKYINSQMHQLRHVFKWAASRELAPVTVYQSLCAIEPLKRGRTSARETEKTGPVPENLIDGIRPHLARPVRALMELQLLTGARSGELLSLRPYDIEMPEQGGVWMYRPESHKNAYRGHDRFIYFGPKSQAILGPFLADRPTSAYLFSPVEAETERREALHASRKTPLAYGNRPGTNRKRSPRRKAGDHYTTASYRRAIQYACDRAFPPPAPLARHERETTKEWFRRLEEGGLIDELRTWRKSHRWHPHQLRHNAATLLRREFGLEAAQLALGHASAQITDAVYAERDHAKVIEIMRKIG